MPTGARCAIYILSGRAASIGAARDYVGQSASRTRVALPRPPPPLSLYCFNTITQVLFTINFTYKLYKTYVILFYLLITLRENKNDTEIWFNLKPRIPNTYLHLKATISLKLSMLRQWKL